MQNYTIITTGENTTITNNKLASKDHYGDESINGTATTLENNVATTHKIDITDNNLDLYLEYNKDFDMHYLNSSLFENAEVTINSSLIHNLHVGANNATKNNYYSLTITSINAPYLYSLHTDKYSNITLLNSYLPQASLVPVNFYSYLTVENCTFLEAMNINKSTKVRNITTKDSTFLNETNNTFLLAQAYLGHGVANLKNYTGYFDSTTNKLLSTTPNNMNLIIRGYNATYNSPMIIDKPINITSYDVAKWNRNITFIPGSEGSTISGLIINSTLKIETNNIHVFNNTINKLIVTNSMNNNIHDDIFNSTETAIEVNSSYNNKIANNSINITNDNAISIDSESFDNNITDNILIANNNYNIKAVSGNIAENTIINNTPLLNTTIDINLQNSTLINTEIPINVTVTSNNEFVENGYVVILVNGVEQANQTLTNGKLETTITPTQKGTNTIKAWYFPTNIYNINTQNKTLNVTSIATSIKITNITTAKV
jgi:hypothetical protein